MRNSTFPREKTFRGVYKNLASIGAFIQETCRAAGFSNESAYQVETAVDEACTNIIEHAYCGENKGDIICSCDAVPGRVTVTLKDNGQPFNPSRVPFPDRNCSLEERDSHGLGLFFVYQLMDEVRFDFSDPDFNVLVLTKRQG